MRRGVVFGKFMPPTLGHVQLLAYAQACVDQLYIVVGSLNSADPIPAARRAGWLRAELPDAVVAAPDPSRAEAFSFASMAKAVRACVDEITEGAGVDLCFGAEIYTPIIADVLQAQARNLPEGRAALAISGSEARADPRGRWCMIAPAARDYFRAELLCVVTDRAEAEALRLAARAAGAAAASLDDGADAQPEAALNAARRVAGPVLVTTLRDIARFVPRDVDPVAEPLAGPTWCVGAPAPAPVGAAALRGWADLPTPDAMAEIVRDLMAPRHDG